MRYMDAYPGVGACPGYYGKIILIIIIMLFQNFGIDWDGPVPLSADSDDDGVVVPETICPLNESEFAQLQSLCPLSRLLSSDCHGIDVYMEARQFASARLTRSYQ